MKRVSVALCALAVAISGALVSAGTVASAQSAKPKATEVGVTADTIRIAVIADVDNPFSPGLFKANADAVEGAAKYINANGGIAGRKLKVDFIDSKLNPNASRNAVITACQQDLAMVGTAAFFMTNMQDGIDCKNQAGQAVGLPDIGAIIAGLPESCNPVSYPAFPPIILCDTATQHPQTWQTGTGDSRYLLNKYKSLHGASLYTSDTPDVEHVGEVVKGGQEHRGIKFDQTFTFTSSATQSVFTPVVQQLKADNSNFASFGGPYQNMIQLRQEAELQGLTDPNFVWLCNADCYTPKFLAAGASADKTYFTIPFLPFDETHYNVVLANYVKYTGKDNLSGVGVYSWAAALAFQQAVNDLVKKDGDNGLTRANLLTALKNLTNFDFGGMFSKANIGGKVLSGCFVMMQVQNGKFVRVWPKKKGTMDCRPTNRSELKLDLLKS